MRLSILSPFVSINDALLSSGVSTETTSAAAGATLQDTGNSYSLSMLGLDAATAPYSSDKQHKDGFVTTVVDTASLQSRFYDKVHESKDKLFVIADRAQQQDNINRPLKNKREDWCVVQVDWDRTNMEDATRRGIYVVKRYVRHSHDAIKVNSSQCRFWPEIREEAPETTPQSSMDGSPKQQVRRRSSTNGPKKGLLHLVDPTKTVPFEKALHKWKWVHETVHLFEEQLVGPFDFVTLDKQSHRIPPKIWDELKSNVQQKKDQVIDLESIDRKVLIHWSH